MQTKKYENTYQQRRNHQEKQLIIFASFEWEKIKESAPNSAVLTPRFKEIENTEIFQLQE